MAAHYTAEERQRLAIAHFNSAMESLHNAADLIPCGSLPDTPNISITGILKQIERLREAAKTSSGSKYFELMAELKELMRRKTTTQYI